MPGGGNSALAFRALDEPYLQNAEDEQGCYNLLIQKWEELKEKGGKHELRF